MFDRLTKSFAADSVACALEWLAFEVRPPYVSSFRPDSAVPGHEFHDPIDVLHALHAPSKIVVHTILLIILLLPVMSSARLKRM